MPRPRRHHSYQHNHVQRNQVQRDTVQCDTVQCDTVQCDTVRRDTVRRDTVRRGREARWWHGRRRLRLVGGTPIIAIAVAVSPAILVACTDSADLDTGPSTPVRLATSAPSSPAQDWELASVAPAVTNIADEPAVKGYIAFREAAYEALKRLDRDYPPLAATSTGEQLDFAKSVVDRFVREGLQARGKARWSVVAATPLGDGRTDIAACQWDSAAWAVDANGDIVDPVSDRWLPLVTTMENVDGRWVATTSREGDVPCELAR